MNDQFKKCYTCGALIIVLYSTSPFCEMCFEDQCADLPDIKYPIGIEITNAIASTISADITIQFSDD